MNKIQVVRFLFVVMFAFKLIAVQEYFHISQHKAEKIHTDDCQVCHTIFKIGKFQTFNTPEISDFTFQTFSEKIFLETYSYKFLYFNKIAPSELYNRPPPANS